MKKKKVLKKKAVKKKASSRSRPRDILGDCRKKILRLRSELKIILKKFEF